MDEPACALRRLTTTMSPTDTFSWRPPALTIAYTMMRSLSLDRFPTAAAPSTDGRRWVWALPRRRTNVPAKRGSGQTPRWAWACREEARRCVRLPLPFGLGFDLASVLRNKLGELRELHRN